MSTIEIRQATMADRDAIVRVFRDSFIPITQDCFPGIDISPFTIEAFTPLWEELMSDPNNGIFVAVDDAHIVGVVALAPTRNPRVLELEKLFIDPSHQGRKIGPALVEQAINYAQEMGCSSLVLSTWEASKPSQKLYESMGFVRTGERSQSQYNGIPAENQTTLRYMLALQPARDPTPPPVHRFY
ncbi:MAG TPA: GNAT family N-acetyltransferase [Acidimicrobiia bacterium]|nr:GNAT family N-acetyltransferase [Acidimicrobiia bacterium]